MSNNEVIDPNYEKEVDKGDFVKIIFVVTKADWEQFGRVAQALNQKLVTNPQTHQTVPMIPRPTVAMFAKSSLYGTYNQIIQDQQQAIVQAQRQYQQSQSQQPQYPQGQPRQ